MAEQDPKQQTEPAEQQAPPKSQAGATGEVSDEELDQAAGGAGASYAHDKSRVVIAIDGNAS